MRAGRRQIVSKKKNVVIVMGNDVKEIIANADLSGIIDLVSELIVKKMICEITDSKTKSEDDSSFIEK
jgi:hypothetical protein